MQAMNRFVEYFGAYMDEAGRLALADAAVARTAHSFAAAGVG